VQVRLSCSSKPLISIELLNALYSYNSETGEVVSLSNGSDLKRITIANGLSYYHGMIMRRDYKTHRVAWALHYGEWPELFIDHIDRNGLNNKIENLRLVTNSQNQQNRKINDNNRSGFKGVWAKCGKWQAKIQSSGVRYHLGVFSTPEDAHIAYCNAANSLNSEYARHA